jgi:CBS domain containing-hemolysin-like protein
MFPVSSYSMGTITPRAAISVVSSAAGVHNFRTYSPMLTLVIAVAFTLVVSAVCSVLEAMILSTTPTDIETLKKSDRVKGEQLEEIREDIEETISSILTLNTLANTLGAVVVGGIATKLFGESTIGIVSGAMAFSILIFSEIIPKNIGVNYRRALQPLSVAPLRLIRSSLRPVTFVANKLVKSLMRKKVEEAETGSEIILLAEKGVVDGELDREEVTLISNALSLASVRVSDIMTPRTVVIGAPEGERLIDLLQRLRTISFGRMPVYQKTIDEVTGIIRRRDILHAIAVGEGHKLVRDLKHEAVFFTEFSTASHALETLLEGQQQLGMVVDEFGAFAGVISMEDIIEHLIGKEIYEKDDVAVDMRQLARLKSKLIGLRI